MAPSSKSTVEGAARISSTAMVVMMVAVVVAVMVRMLLGFDVLLCWSRHIRT